MRITKVEVNASNDMVTDKQKKLLVLLDEWNYKYRNVGYGAARVKDTLKRVGLNVNDFKIRNSIKSGTKISFTTSYDSQDRKLFVSKIPDLVANGFEITVIVNNNKISTFTIESYVESADVEVAVYGIEGGKFIFWTTDQKNEQGRDLMLTFTGERAVAEAGKCCTKYEVR